MSSHSDRTSADDTATLAPGLWAWSQAAYHACSGIGGGGCAFLPWTCSRGVLSSARRMTVEPAPTILPLARIQPRGRPGPASRWPGDRGDVGGGDEAILGEESGGRPSGDDACRGGDSGDRGDMGDILAGGVRGAELGDTRPGMAMGFG